MSDSTNEKEVAIIPGCIVCKTCEFHAPDVFVVDEKAFSARVLNPKPGPEQTAAVKEAIRFCPEHVITYKNKTK